MVDIMASSVLITIGRPALCVSLCYTSSMCECITQSLLIVCDGVMTTEVQTQIEVSREAIADDLVS